MVCFMGVIAIAEAAEQARNGLSAVGGERIELLLRAFGICRAD